MDFIEKIKTAGIVGAGGAGFPSYVKLDTTAECFIVNAAECEPLIETDKYLCRTYAEKIVAGTMLIAKHLQAKRVVIALKERYVAEIASLAAAITKLQVPIEIFRMRAFYPAGDEQTLVHQVMGYSIPERGLPKDVGAVVDNVGTVLNIWDALAQEQPVTMKYLSVVGAVTTKCMLHVPIGTPIRQCIELAGPCCNEYAVVMGGPMMGKLLDTNDKIEEAVVTKTTGNLLVLPMEHYLVRRAEMSLARIRRQAVSACIQCRMCTDLCPRYLIGHKIRPNRIMRNLFREHMLDEEAYKEAFGEAVNCCDCGICEMFACPMGLSPRKVNDYFKDELKRKGIQVEKHQAPVAKETVNIHKVPTDRLIARLGLTSYVTQDKLECRELRTAEVHIPMSMHIGKPAVVAVTVGDTVQKGQCIGTAATGLSANIHASIDGVVTDVAASGVVTIRVKEEDNR